MAKSVGFGSALTAILTTFWVGGLWMTGVTAYVLFQTLPDHSQAGLLAGKLFGLISNIGMVAGAWWLLQAMLKQGWAVMKLSVFWSVLLMWLLVLVGEFGIQPLLAQLKANALPQDVMHSVFASRFKTWHGIASVAYVMECVLGIWLVIQSRTGAR